MKDGDLFVKCGKDGQYFWCIYREKGSRVLYESTVRELAAQGMTRRAIAQKLKMHTSVVGRIFDDFDIQSLNKPGQYDRSKMKKKDKND